MAAVRKTTRQKLSAELSVKTIDDTEESHGDSPYQMSFVLC